MPNRPNSKIEVDLKLIDDRNVKILSAFGKEFDASVSRLSKAIEREMNNISKIVNARGGGPGPSPNASTGATFTPPPGGPTARQGGAPPPGQGSNYTMGGGGSGGGGPSVAPAGDYDSFERQYIHAQRRIGEIPVGLRQALGYFADGGPRTDADGNMIDKNGNWIDSDGNPSSTPVKDPLARWRNTAARINTNLFNAQAVTQNARLGYQGLQNIYGSVAAPMMVGQQLGYSRRGLFGTPFLSPAFKAGLHGWWNSLTSSAFGFDPNYSTKQAQEATQAVQSYGYSFKTADVIQEQLKHLQMQGLDAGEMMSMIDPLMRFGNPEQSGAQLVNILRAIPEAAKAASMNLKTFTDQLVQTSTSVAQQMGMQPGQVASALSSFSATTGLSPERAAGLFNANNMIMASALTGKSLTELNEHPQVAPMMAFGQQIFQNMTGMTGQQLLNLRKRDRKAYDQIMNPVYMLYNQNPEIFGGFSPRDLINMSVRNRGRTRQHIAVDQQIHDFNPLREGGVDHLESLLGSYGPHSKDLVRDFEQWRQAYIADPHNKVNTDAGLRKFRLQAQKEAETLMGNNQRQQGRRAAVAVTIDAAPYLKKYLDIITKTTDAPEDVPSRNAYVPSSLRGAHPMSPRG